MDEILWHRRESRRQRRRRTSSCSSGRLLPTRSQVWQATDTQLNREVALKILRKVKKFETDVSDVSAWSAGCFWLDVYLAGRKVTI